MWWSTDPRMVLKTTDFIASTSLRKTLRKIDRSMHDEGRWQVRFDTAFEAVVRACAEPRNGVAGTWISDDIVAGYNGLHRLGHAHSAELWCDGALVGGAYGVCIGRMFYGESMFARVTDASKIALAYLVDFLKANGVVMIDCQQQTAHLASLGAKPLCRDAFMQHLQVATLQPGISVWRPLSRYPCNSG